mgnify:CR=1 FL=1
MAAQVAFPLLARAMGFAKGLTGAGKAAGAAAPTIKGMLAGQTARRMAGQTMGEFGKRLGPIGFGSQDAITNTALMFGPDLAFGALAGSMTPGDLGDKLIAGTMTGLGGAVGGAGHVDRACDRQPDGALRGGGHALEWRLLGHQRHSHRDQ